MKVCERLHEIPVDKARSVLVYDSAVAGSVDLEPVLSRFTRVYPLQAGESLKNWDVVGQLLGRLSRECPFLSRQSGTIYALGGGTVGDAVGFAASVLERGVRFENIPSTWLAAMDSAHGGKTAVNIEGFKNRVGTFYPAGEVWLVREVLQAQPPALEANARAELIKMAWIDGGPWTARLHERLWDLLPAAIEAKLKIVAQDPTETRGLRAILNLGHTVAHALEPAAGLGLDHGAAVGAGLCFAVEWSRHLQRISAKTEERLLAQVRAWRPTARVSASFVRSALEQDKKRRATGSEGLEIYEGFLREDPSRPLGVRTEMEWVSVAAFIEELSRQGWLREGGIQ